MGGNGPVYMQIKAAICEKWQSCSFLRCPPLFYAYRYFRVILVTGEIRTPPFAISRAEFKEAPFLRAQIRAFFPQNFIRSFGRLFVGFVEAIK